ncbi:MAG: FMN-binding protein [Alicyclobacillus sp.]|nr:FMN-binding protein [Alicyclobacillus sp.]
MGSKFVALATLAVGAIYASGYAVSGESPRAAETTSGSVAASNASSNPSPGSNHAASNVSSGANHTASGDASAAGSHGTTNGASKPSSHVDTAQRYLDGTYQGSASNRIGTVAVAVTIHSGKIAEVQITQCDTHYPEYDIDPVLPQYVVQHQSTQIPVVSGATLSTEDFYYAVLQALNQAKNPNYKG